MKASRSIIPFHSFAPELAALEWTTEGELAATARCQMVQRLLEAETQSANQVELIRVSHPWCAKDNEESSPGHLKSDGCCGVSPGSPPLHHHQESDAPALG